MNDTYVWEDGMEEISGFGGRYEKTCQAMLKAGMEWLDAHPEAIPEFRGSESSYGIISATNADAKALTEAVIGASEKHATGAMQEFVIERCLFIRKHGWDEHVRRSKAEEVKREWKRIGL